MRVSKEGRKLLKNILYRVSSVVVYYYIHLPGRSFSLTIISFIGFLSVLFASK